VFVVGENHLVGRVVGRGVDVAADPCPGRGAEHVFQGAGGEGGDHLVELLDGRDVEAAKQQCAVLQQFLFQ
jgi:hypothetical protein